MNNNIRTMEFLGEDDWNNDVYKCIETEILYKNGNDSMFVTPELYSCGNSFDGDMGFPINSNLEIHFIGIPVRSTEEQKFSYMMLGRLQSDCEYYLGYGNRYAKHLWAGDEQDQIKSMK